MVDPEAVSETIESLLETPADDALAVVADPEATTLEDEQLLDVLGRRHALAVLEAVVTADGGVRFSELERALSASPSTLSARLSTLVEVGLLERTTYDEVPPRVEYGSTEAGAALAPLFAYLSLWESRYGLE